MFTSRYQKAGRNHNKRPDNKPLKLWKSSNIWEQLQQIKILFRKKVRAGWSQGMTAIIRCRIYCFSSLLSKNLKIKIYRTTILPVVLHGCETWSLKLKEESRLRVFENRVLRRIFVPRRDGVTGEWRKLHNEELNDLYSPNIFRVIKLRRVGWYWHVERMGERRGVYWVLVGQPEGKRPLGRPRRRWEDNIKMDLQEVGRDCGDWMELAKDRDRWRALVSTVMNFRVP